MKLEKYEIQQCIYKEELNKFEMHTLQAYLNSLTHLDEQEKQQELSKFIKNNAGLMRETFCKNICGLYYKCAVYNAIQD